MDWREEWGSQLDMLLERERKSGVTPPSLQKLRQLTPTQSDFLLSFTMLDKSRHQGFAGPGYIPLAEMEVYCRIFHVVDWEYFITLMRQIDSRVMVFRSKKRARSKPGKKASKQAKKAAHKGRRAISKGRRRR